MTVLECAARFARNRELLEIDPIGVAVPLPTILRRFGEVVTIRRFGEVVTASSSS